MIGFLAKVVWGAGKLSVKYIVLPAVLSVGIAIAADALAQRIKQSTVSANHRLENNAVLPGF